MSQVRLPKFRRVPEAVAGKRLTERDFEIIRVILRYRLISTGTLLWVIGGNEDVTHRHLSTLYHADLISRFTLPRHGNPGEFIYFLENATGLRQIASRLGDAPVDWDDIHRNRERLGPLPHLQNGDGFGKFLFVRHELMISDFHAGLEIACRASEGRVQLERWRQDPGIWDRVKTSPKRILPHRPDAFFTLHFPLAAEGQQRSNFFYEADRGTSNMTRFIQKLQAYIAYLKQGRQAALDVRRVRAVLIQTISQERLEECAEAIRILAKSEPVASSLFWLGHTNASAEHAFEAAWQSATDASQRTLSD